MNLRHLTASSHTGTETGPRTDASGPLCASLSLQDSPVADTVGWLPSARFPPLLPFPPDKAPFFGLVVAVGHCPGQRSIGTSQLRRGTPGRLLPNGQLCLSGSQRARPSCRVLTTGGRGRTEPCPDGPSHLQPWKVRLLCSGYPRASFCSLHPRAPPCLLAKGRCEGGLGNAPDTLTALF